MKSHEKALELSLIRTYPQQVVWEVWLPADPVKETTTVTTGVIATSYQISKNDVISFAARFASTFVEYRMIRAEFKVRLFSSNNPGVIHVWYDEQSTAAPTLLEAEERFVLSISASNVSSNNVLKWTCADPLDLQYRPIGTAYTPVTFKVYTDNANLGSSVVATDYFEVVPRIQFQFRGLMGV
jgi:hypothetical protein